MQINTKTQISPGIYADYNTEHQTVELSREFLDGIIALDHEALQQLGKFILKLQKDLHDQQTAAQPNQPEVMEDQPLEEVTLESEIARVKAILDGAGIFEAGSEPEFVEAMRSDVEFAERSIRDENPFDQVQSMNRLAKWN